MSLEDSTKFVYTLSSSNSMVKDAIRSIRSLKRFVCSDNIHVFYTPPHNQEDEDKLKSLGVNVHLQSNETDAFRMRGLSDDRHFGEKSNLCKIDSDIVVFLDCDTVVLGDIWKSIEGEFDFKARPGSAGINEDEWEKLFDDANKDPLMWMPNAGFMIFKNRIHKKIENEWINLLNREYDYRKDGVLHKEQIALALSVSEFETVKMSKDEHVFEWLDEENPNGIVYHLAIESNDTYPIDNFIKIFDKRLPFNLNESNATQRFRDWVVNK